MTTTPTRERSDLIAALQKARYFLRYTARDLSDDQAATRSGASELTVGGLIKHVASVESTWQRFVTEGPAAFPPNDDPAVFAARAAGFVMQPGETLAGLLAGYEQVAARTDAMVADLPDLDAEQPLPAAPWFPPGARWSARQVMLHIVAETAQHAGHADIVREGIDGAKSMG
ncbi:MAG: DinB family protein [Jatrophihabitans sp.]|nr:MAG: DinB family protein [Jatrophihabitans sp.]